MDFGVLEEEKAGGGHLARFWRTRSPELLCLIHHPLSQETPSVQQMPLLKLLVDYLPSIFISGVNFLLPPVFKLIALLEGYTRSHQIAFILLRFYLCGCAGDDGRAGVKDTGSSTQGTEIPWIWDPVRSGFKS